MGPFTIDATIAIAIGVPGLIIAGMTWRDSRKRGIGVEGTQKLPFLFLVEQNAGGAHFTSASSWRY